MKGGSKRVMWAGAALAALVVSLATPLEALACPTCATRDSGRGVYLLVGLMIAVPYLVAVVVYRIIRRTLRDESAAVAQARGPS